MTLLDFDQIPEQALRWHDDGGSVLATVIQTWGSAPRGVGSQLAVSSRGEISGSVSGGCVEGAIVAEARDILTDGVPKIFEFGVSDNDAFAVGLACGGKIRILVEPIGSNQGISRNDLLKITQYRAERKPVAMLINIETWNHSISFGRTGLLGHEVDTRLKRDHSGFEDEWFVNVFNPPLRLIVVGGVHIAQPLIIMAKLAGYDILLIDPREAFATEQRFPDVKISHDWPDEAIDRFKPDTRTAVVTLSHDPKIDDPAIGRALASHVFYIGCLGSRRTHAKRLERMQSNRYSTEVIHRIDAPIGLDIGASTPSEIAISIMAQMTSRLRQSIPE